MSLADDITTIMDPGCGTGPSSMIQHPLQYRLYLFDVDGTLRGCYQEGQRCPNRQEDWLLLPNVRDTLTLYQWGVIHRWSFIANQAGVALGFLDALTCLGMLDSLREACGLPLPNYWQVCMHHPKMGCWCRKPSPYMLLQAMKEADIPLWDVIYVGDMSSDREAAQRAGIAYMPAAQFFGWRQEKGAVPGLSFR